MSTPRADPSSGVDKNTLINLGYNLAVANRLQDAICAMQLAVHEYPDFWNDYDGLAEM